MSRPLREEEMLTEDELESQDSASNGIDEGSKYFTKDGSISPPDKEKYDAAQVELLRTTTDCAGYVASLSSAAENQEGDKNASPSETRVNLLEKTRIWKNRQLRELQYDSLKYYYAKMIGRSVSFNWCKRFDDVSYKKPKMIEDLPCQCDLEEGRKILENSCNGDTEKQTELKSPVKELNISITSPFRKLAKHNNTCNARRICFYFSCIAKYFIEEEVDPDLFLFIPFPKGKYGEDSVDYKYYILQESRKILILKLWEGLRRRLESWMEGMTGKDVLRYEYRNEVRIAKHLVLNNLLEDLVKPYENFTYKKKNDDNSNLKQNASKQIADQIDQDKRKYLSLKAEYQSMKKRLEKEASERHNEESIDDALHFDFYISYEDFLEQENSQENKPSIEKGEEMELDVKISIKAEKATDESESERKRDDFEPGAEEPMSDLEETEELEPGTEEPKSDLEETEEPEPGTEEPKSDLEETEEPVSKRKMDELEKETGEPEVKRKKSDSEEPEGKRKKGDSDEETEKPETKRKKADPDEETGEPDGETEMVDLELESEEPQGKRKIGDSDRETEEPQSKRKMGDSDHRYAYRESEEPQSKRKMGDLDHRYSDREIEKPEIKRKREEELSKGYIGYKEHKECAMS